MPFNSLIDRTDVAGLIPQDQADAIIQEIPQSSYVLNAANRLRNMTTKQQKMTVLSALPYAYFVDGDTGLKQTTQVEWADKYLTAEEIAVIVPVPDSVAEDMSYKIWDELRPLIAEAFGVLIDGATIYGTSIPASWSTSMGGAGLLAVATAASQVISAAAYTDLYEAILGETAAGVSGLVGKVEEDGYMVNRHLGHLSFRRKLRNVRDSTGTPIFQPSMTDRGSYTLDGVPIDFPTNGAVSATYLDICGDWSKLVYSVRTDMTWKIADTGVINDAAGNIIYNLFQQDMKALRVTMRLGFALPNPVNRVNQTAATRCPFAFLTA